LRGWYGGCKEEAMSGLRIFGIVLIVLGVLGLVYGQFSYTRKTHDADLGVVKLQIKEKETVDVPTWAGVAAIAAGAVLLVVGRKR
jgi:multidrug transporter EmrE-like cation transporter